MLNLHLEELNTFGKGRWEFLLSAKSCAESYEQSCKKLFMYSQNTPLCLCEMKHVKEILEDNDVFVFIDNENNVQIVGDCKPYGSLNAFRGVDGIEQNIDLSFLDVANEFLDKNSDLRNCECWRYQTNWLARLNQYNKLFNGKKYAEIDVESLIDDLGYNGYDLHYKDCTKESKKRIYYPIIKRELIAQPMCKPMIAKFLGCKTYEVYIGKYSGNGKKLKYIVGDCISQFLSADCKLEKVFGSIEVKNYCGKANLFTVPTTENFSISGDANGVLDYTVDELISNAKIIENVSDIHK